ncbi:MAG: DEAD/DEAH box helicase [Actinomycetota bacterium]
MRFEDFDLRPEILRALADLGYEEPTPIQEGTIDALLRDKDMIGQAQTGSGKTAAFMLPILDRIEEDSTDLQALVLCPTRKLALQVADATRSFAKYLDGVEVVPVYGGAPIVDQIAALGRGGQIVVGTPGRVLDLLRRGKMILSDCRMVVLDEADEMLSMGFIDDVRDIFKRTPWGKQTALFSATMPDPIKRLAEEELHAPVHVKIASKEITVDTIEQRVAFCEPKDKIDLLERFLKEADPRCAIVFARTKIGTQRLADDLKRRGHKVRALHCDMSQGSRDSVMIAFRSQRVPLLVATDVAARGLDVSHVTHVVNYELPDEAEVYVHRVGRTGRVGREGFAISFVAKKEQPKLDQVEALLKRKIQVWGEDAPAAAPTATATPAAPVGEDEVTAEVVAPPTSGGAPAGDAATGTGDGPKRRRRRRGGRGRGTGGEGGQPSAPVAAE